MKSVKESSHISNTYRNKLRGWLFSDPKPLALALLPRLNPLPSLTLDYY